MTRRKPYVRSMNGWWTRHGYFKRYMMREGTSVFLALFALEILFGLVALSRGEAAYDRWLAMLGNPLLIIFHLLVFAAACYHTYTWFSVSPKTMPPLQLKGKTITPDKIVAGQYVVLAITTLVVIVLVAIPGLI